MKKIAFLLSLPFLINCTSENSEDVSVDCSNSDLSLTVESRVLPGCQRPGSFEVIATGGDEDYEYTIDGQSYQGSGVFASLESGVYEVTVRDGLGCETSLSINLTGAAALTVSLETEGCGDNDGRITALASGGDGDYQYSLNNGAFQDENVFTGLSAGRYTVRVVDGSDCSTTSSAVKLGISLASDIMPIINNNCATNGCHANSQSPLLTSESSVIAAASRIKARVEAGTMPPSGSLPESQVQAISDWVDCGATDN